MTRLMLSACLTLLALPVSAALVTLPEVNEGSSFAVTLTFFADTKQCKGGSVPGTSCTSASTCTGGGTCSFEVTPTQLQCNLIVQSDPGPGQELWPLQSYSPSSSSHKVSIPDTVNVIVASEANKPKPDVQYDRFSCRWTWPGGTRREEWIIPVRNLAAQPFSP